MSARSELRAIILAAGFGSRLGAHTRHHHKCILEVGGLPILTRTLETLVTAGIRKATLVVGHLGAQVRACANAWRNHVDLRYVVNDRFATTGSGRSLALGLSTAGRRDNVLVIEADVVFEYEALTPLLEAFEPQGTLVAPFGTNLTGSAVVCDANGRVRDWLHATHQGRGFRYARAYKTVNLTRLDQQATGALLDHCVAAGDRAPLEYAMRALVRTRLARIHAVDVGRARWCEVDTPEDLRLAEEMFGVGALAGRA